MITDPHLIYFLSFKRARKLHQKFIIQRLFAIQKSKETAPQVHNTTSVSVFFTCCSKPYICMMEYFSSIAPPHSITYYCGRWSLFIHDDWSYTFVTAVCDVCYVRNVCQSFWTFVMMCLAIIGTCHVHRPARHIAVKDKPVIEAFFTNADMLDFMIVMWGETVMIFLQQCRVRI